MSQIEGLGAFFAVLRPKHNLARRFTPAKTKPVRLNIPHRLHPSRTPRQGRHRRQRCDCGRLAVRVINVKVGSDPQYTVSLPLCSMCLSMEQGMQDED